MIYPWLIKGGKPTPVFLAFLAFSFCALNGYLQARHLTKFAYYKTSWLSNPCFICGVALFFTGMVINIHSDHTLRNLRKPGETGYKIPKGRLLYIPTSLFRENEFYVPELITVKPVHAFTSLTD